jgi:predicted amidohydrolase
MAKNTLILALITEVFHEEGGTERLVRCLEEAQRQGAELALLPELPLNRWAPVSRNARAEDAEEPRGPRHQRLAEAARTARIGLVGGAIVREPSSGRRFNRALVFDAEGRLVATYDKLHIPAEEGFWESDHYGAGSEPPRPIEAFGLTVGLQICSDLHRPQGCHVLGAAGTEAILAPRATPASSYERWKLVIRANAIAAACYLVSVNRPGPEGEVSIGGPSLAVDPEGKVVLETTEPLHVVTLERDAVVRARAAYPGYLEVRTDLYAKAWSQVGAKMKE